jgi:endonuclease/exonuclease/phosphatase family metal-dependent hydrolase
MVGVGTWNLENLYRPGGAFVPRTREAYDEKLDALAWTIDSLDVDVLAVQEVGEPEALRDLVKRLSGTWHTRLSTEADGRGIRVGVLSRLKLLEAQDVVDFPAQLPPLRADDSAAVTSRMGRGALRVRVRTRPGALLDVVTCHLKSKLLTFPGGRFSPHDEGERARYGAYALFRRTAEAATVRDLADRTLRGRGRSRALVVCGDLNDVPGAATSQILLGPQGSEIGEEGELIPDAGDAWRLWNLAPLIPEKVRFSRIERGRAELLDQILVSRALLDHVREATSVVDRPMPDISGDPRQRRNVPDSDHAPVVARFAV